MEDTQAETQAKKIEQLETQRKASLNEKSEQESKVSKLEKKVKALIKRSVGFNKVNDSVKV